MRRALAKAATASTLADDPTYRDDLRPLGDHVASVWVDSARLKPLAGKSGLEDEFFPYADVVGGTGRTALVLRFTDSAVEVVGRTNLPDAQGSAQGQPARPAPGEHDGGLRDDRRRRSSEAGLGCVLEQPSSLSDAFGDDLSASGDPDATNPDRPLDMAAEFKKDYGLTMPKDLISVFGTDFMFAAARTGAAPTTRCARPCQRMHADAPRVRFAQVVQLARPASRDDDAVRAGLERQRGVRRDDRQREPRLVRRLPCGFPRHRARLVGAVRQLGAGLVALQGRRHRSPGHPGHHAEPGREQHQDLRTPHRPLTAPSQRLPRLVEGQAPLRATRGVRKPPQVGMGVRVGSAR